MEGKSKISPERRLVMMHTRRMLSGSSDSDSAMDEVQASENHSSKCHLDYCLLTFQEMGCYINNNSGSYYDHSKILVE